MSYSYDNKTSQTTGPVNTAATSGGPTQINFSPMPSAIEGNLIANTGAAVSSYTPWIIGGVVVLGLAFLYFRSRRG